MKKCKCEHWQTCPVCYPQGFDEAGNRKPVEIPPTRGEMLARIKAERDALKLRIQLAEGNVARHRETYGIIVAERDEYRTKYQINAARSDERCKQLCEMESERDTLKAENIALIGSGVKNEAERGNDGFLMTKIADLIQERDALAMQNQQMRDALESIQRYGFDMLSGRVDGPDDRAWQRSGVNEMTKRAQSALALLDTSEIIKRHDADKKDAERYRWLRATCDDYSRSDVFNRWEEEDLDAAIDAEIGAQL